MRKLFFFTAVWLAIVRVWMLTVLPNYLEDSRLVYALVKDDYHHWMFGVGLFAGFLVFKLIFRKLSFIFLPGMTFSLALVLDQYSYIATSLGISLAIVYLSIVDTSIVVGIIVGLVMLSQTFKSESTRALKKTK